MQKDFEKIIFARKYLIGEKHHIWDQIKLITQKLRIHFNMLQET
jgi:hypothetical protein